MLGAIKVAHLYRWSVMVSLCDTLDEEVDIEKTKLVPTDEDLPRETPWVNKFGPTGPAPHDLNEKMTMNLIEYSQQHGLLEYNWEDRDSLKNLQTIIKGDKCDKCELGICLWEGNKQKVLADNERFRPNATNKQHRFTAYRQFTYLIHGPLAKGDCQKLPDCVTDGIRATWPEESDTSTLVSRTARQSSIVVMVDVQVRVEVLVGVVDVSMDANELAENIWDRT
jgi:hypothetical protein